MDLPAPDVEGYKGAGKTLACYQQLLQVIAANSGGEGDSKQAPRASAFEIASKIGAEFCQHNSAPEPLADMSADLKKLLPDTRVCAVTTMLGGVSRRPAGSARVCMSSETSSVTEKPQAEARAMEEEVDPGEVEGTDLRVLKYPHPALRAENEEIEAFDDDLKKLAKDMFKVMYASKGVGLAAPQVGVNKRLMVFNPEGDPRNWLDEAVLVNPRIVATGKGKVIDEEGCLSFPGMRGNVERNNWVKVEAQNAKGKKIKKKYTDWTARIFQHEYDHLDGTVYIDRLTPEGMQKVSPERPRMRQDSKVQPVLDKLISDFGEGAAL